MYVTPEGKPVLARTYYSTIEYVQPEAIMQPVWESVKFRNGSVDFRRSYHRAWYASGYDNFHDIFLQRWRKEDREWSVVCVNKITGEERKVLPGIYNDEGDVCNHPQEYKVVNGQGNPVVKTLFLSPNESENSWWRQSSVPAVQPQPWASSYRDGYCGIRKLNDDMDINDPALADFVPMDRSNCSNIADNPIHISEQDKLIGVLRIVTTRRAKYIALSELTSDFLDTTGVLRSFEGEFGKQDLISFITEMGQFNFGPGDEIGSTFHAPIRSEFETAEDYEYRFKQYIRNYNDRATYALACVLDGVCPVNFKDQLKYGA
jgi:hypothetical protein